MTNQPSSANSHPAPVLPQFLTDTPSAKAEEPHASIGQRIANAIIAEKGLVVVALCGEYGSGKSTVVECMKQQAVQLGSHVFVFDAWAHKNSSLQRSFLEAWKASLCPRCTRCNCRRDCTPPGHVINSCPDCGHCQCAECRDSRPRSSEPANGESNWLSASAAARITDGLISLAVPNRPVRISAAEQDRRNRKRAINAMLTLLLAVGVILASSETAAEAVADLIQTTNTAIALLGLLVVISTVLLLALGLVFPKSLAGLSPSGDVDPKAALNPADDASGEPPMMVARSTIDVENVFLDIARSARRPKAPPRASAASVSVSPEPTKPPGPERLIVVLDNLDRLGEKGVQQTWASMRLFAHALEKSPEARDRVRIIVPFSPTIESALDTKVFQARFDVPPMAMLRWEDYFSEKFREAFGTDAGMEHARRVVRSWVARRGTAPTPREIIRLINDVVAIAISRGGALDLPIDHVVFYAIDRLGRTQEEIRLGLLDQKRSFGRSIVPDSNVLEDPWGLHLSLAKLVFATRSNVDAAELTIVNSLTTALLTHNAKESQVDLKTIVHSQGFWPFMDFLGENAFEMLRDQSILFVDVAAHLVDAGIIDAARSSTSGTTSQRWKILQKIGRSLRRTGGDSHPLRMTLGATGKLMRLCQDAGVSSELWRALGQQMNNAQILSEFGIPNREIASAVAHLREVQRQIDLSADDRLDVAWVPRTPFSVHPIGRSHEARLLYLAYAFLDDVNNGGPPEGTRSVDGKWMKNFNWELTGEHVFFTWDGLLNHLRQTNRDDLATFANGYLRSISWRFAAMQVAARHDLPCNWQNVAKEVRALFDIPNLPFMVRGWMLWIMHHPRLAEFFPQSRLDSLCSAELLWSAVSRDDPQSVGVAMSLILHRWNTEDVQRTVDPRLIPLRVPGDPLGEEPTLDKFVLEFGSALAIFAPPETLKRLEKIEEFSELLQATRRAHTLWDAAASQSAYRPFVIVPSVLKPSRGALGSSTEGGRSANVVDPIDK